MGFSLSDISWANLFENGQNFISFSIMGMTIVFVGLTIISIYIVLLPKILSWPKIREIKQEKIEVDSLMSLEPEIMLAITVALHLDQTNSGSYEKITWDRSSTKESAWLTAGRMRALAVRSHLPDKRG